MTQPLAGKCVLIVEDEAMIALDLASQVAARGAEVVCPVGVEAALKAVNETALDGAIVDISLTDRADFQVINALVDRHVPLVLTTGYDIANGIPASLVNVRCFVKPTPATVICSALEASISGGGESNE